MDVLTQTCASVGSAFEAFWKLRGGRHVAFLDSASSDARLGRLSVVATDPVLVFTARGDHVTLVGGRIHFEERGNPWTALRALAGRFQMGGADIPVCANGLRTGGMQT
ncbi:MAG: hypothetical protein N2689_16040, partial [Verrucomicrobiae bacterium]|nr:hypothetical protein [Verrucomicrobiae bacterium]